MGNDTIKFKEKDIKEYLDKCIVLWRKKKQEAINKKDEEDKLVAMCYVDAFQSVRISLFGELLPA